MPRTSPRCPRARSIETSPKAVSIPRAAARVAGDLIPAASPIWPIESPDRSIAPASAHNNLKAAGHSRKANMAPHCGKRLRYSRTTGLAREGPREPNFNSAEVRPDVSATPGDWVRLGRVAPRGKRGPDSVFRRSSRILDMVPPSLFHVRRLSAIRSPPRRVTTDSVGFSFSPSELSESHCELLPCKTQKGVEPRTPREPPARGVRNAPWPTPLAGRGTRHCILTQNFAGFSLEQRLDHAVKLSCHGLCRSPRRSSSSQSA